MRPLPELPTDALAGAGTLGGFRGALATTALDGVAATLGLSGLARRLREKRWVWFGAGDERLAVGGAIVELGYSGTVFLWVLDRRERRLLVDGSTLLPPGLSRVSDAPADGLVARGGRPLGPRLSLARKGGSLAVEGRAFGVELELSFSAAEVAPLTAICPVPAGRNVTQKLAALPAGGRLRVAGRELRLEGAHGFLDYTHGLLARDTAWRWAAAFGRDDAGRPVGLNLTAGFNDGLENAIWLDGEPLAVGAAQFEHDPKAPASPWRVRTEDGAVELELDVEAVRAENVDLGLAVSRYAQPIGRYHGRIGDRPVSALFGVAEDHVARW